jgi:flagellar capping protein FliD
MSDLFQITGVSSGIAWDEIINKTLEKAKKPAELWKKQIDTLEVKKTLYQELQSEFNKLRNSMTKLRLANAYNAKKAEYTSFENSSVKPENIVTAKIGAQAELTWWDIEVKEIARAQRHTTKRFNSVSDPLGISGAFNVRVGRQFATIKIEPTENLRDINYNLSKAVDQDGNPLALTAKIVDNRIVIESAAAGKNSCADDAVSVPFVMGKGNDYYLPHSSLRDETTGKYVYPQQLLKLQYSEKNVSGTDYNYYYVEGRDFTYDASLGKITWLSTATIKPPQGATFQAIYGEWRESERVDNFVRPDGTPDTTLGLPLPVGYGSSDILPPLATGKGYKDLANRKFEILGKDGTEYKQGLDFDVANIDIAGTLYQVVMWKTPGTSITLPDGSTYTTKEPGNAGLNSKYDIRLGAEEDYKYDENVFYLEPTTRQTTPVNITAGNVPSVTPPLTSPPAPPGNIDYLPQNLVALNGRIEIAGSGGVKYIEGLDFTVSTFTHNNVTYKVVEWETPGTTKYDEYGAAHTVINPTVGATLSVRAVVSDDYSSSSALAQLGFITPGATNDAWKFTDGSAIMATDAKFILDGVEVTRPSNTIDNLITNVTFELRGLGKVRINVVRDLEKTVEDMDAFVESYNKVMEWINYYVSQKQDAANPVNEDDHLSSILQQSKGNTVFGALHGDQLLWSIKDQLRSKISDPINTVSTSLSSRKVPDTSAALNIKGSFFIYIGGKAARVDISASDSMDDIRKKIAEAKNIAAPDGTTATGGTPGLNVTIRNGQLVIDSAKTPSQYVSGNMETTSNTMKRDETKTFDYLNFIPVTAPPVNGSLKVISRSGAEYREGIDYKIVTDTDKNNLISSRIEWMGAKAPLPNGLYSVEYTYDPNAVHAAEISGSGPTSSEIAAGMNSLSYLELHQDASKAHLATMGITTEARNNGKSGLIEFDSEKFLTTLGNDPNISATSMVSFMRGFDTYIGNLVDSSQILVAGQPVTKGRIAGALKKIDSEQKTLNDRITKLERELETKQTALYKRYSDMEVAIQKLNAQMSSVANYFSNTNK